MIHELPNISLSNHASYSRLKVFRIHMFKISHRTLHFVDHGCISNITSTKTENGKTATKNRLKAL